MGSEENGIRGMEKSTAIPHKRRAETPDEKNPPYFFSTRSGQGEKSPLRSNEKKQTYIVSVLLYPLSQSSEQRQFCTHLDLTSPVLLSLPV